MKRHPAFVDMTDQTVGCLTVTGEAPGVDGTYWRCLCSVCGETTTVPSKHLRHKKLKWRRCWECPTRGRTRLAVAGEPRPASMLIVKRSHMYEPPRERVRICRQCCNLPWQRPRYGCVSCGEPYAEEVIEAFERRGFSAVALCEVTT